MIKSTMGQHIKYNFYATLLSYILLLHRFGVKSQEHMHLPKNLEVKERTKERGIWGETLFHGKRKWWGTIPPDGIRGEWPETEIRRGSPAPFLSERERRRGEKQMNGYGEVGIPLPGLNPHALSTAW